MHQQAFEFVASHAAGCDGPVVEVGGRDINGTVRGLFGFVDYLSVDLHDGPGVDVVGDVRTLELDPAPTVVCCEVLEHTDDPEGVTAACAQLVDDGGTLLLTCATDPRQPHSATDGGALRDGEHYANVDPDDLVRWLEDAGLDVAACEVDRKRGDLYVKAVRA